MPDDNGARPAPITRAESHDTVMAVFEELPRGAVLDAQCGEGALAVRLEEAGFDVRGCDIDPALLKAKGLEVREADLNLDRIDYPDGSFDHIASVNGLHRLYNIRNAISEFARLLKPGGTLVISIPNYAGIVRRMRFLLTGTVAKNIAQQEYKQVSEKPQAHFRNALTVPQVRSALVANGFTVARVLRGRMRKRAAWLAPVGLLAKLLAPIIYRKRRHAYGLDLANSAPVLFGGHHVCVVATKGK